MPYSKHVKSAVLKKIVEKKVPCDEILREITDLLGLPPPSNNVANEEAVVDPSATSESNEGETAGVEEQTEIDERQKSFDRILDDLTGRERTNAKNILLRIEASPFLSWSYNDDTLIIGEEQQIHSSMKTLIARCVSPSPALPVAFIPFVSGLIDIKIPPVFLSNIDTQNVRKALLKLRKKTTGGNVENLESSSSTSNNNDDEEKNDATEGESETSATAPVNEEALTRRKRSRRDDSEEEEEVEARPSKAAKVTEEAKENGQNRRSSRLRLKPELQKDWTPL